MKIQPGPAKLPKLSSSLAEVTQGDAADAVGRSAQTERRLHGGTPTAPVPSGAPAHLGGGLPPARLQAELARAAAGVEKVAAAPSPADLDQLIDRYAALGQAAAAIQAALISALDALDPNTGGGVARPQDAFADIEQLAASLLRRAGEVFAQIEPSFGEIVHGGSGWPNRPVVKEADRGDGRPLYLYENTFKEGRELSPDERQAEYQERVDKFLAAGGSFDDMFALGPDTLDRLGHRERWDYVMTESGLTRLGSVEGEAKPGHSLLAEGGPELKDDPVLLAGEIWALRDQHGDLEMLLVANNSGHFKPSFEDLQNALGPLAEAGVPPEKVVLYGGPNNLPAIFAEMEEKFGRAGITDRVPPTPNELIERWSEAGASTLQTQLAR